MITNSALDDIKRRVFGELLGHPDDLARQINTTLDISRASHQAKVGFRPLILATL